MAIRNDEAMDDIHKGRKRRNEAQVKGSIKALLTISPPPPYLKGLK